MRRNPSPFKWPHYAPDVILLCVRWYCRYSLSYRDLEEIMRERGLSVDHVTVFRWVLAGTDAPGAYLYPGFSLHDELALLLRAGLRPFEALLAAMRNPAKYLNLSDELGTIKEGKLADLVLLDANSLDNIGNTRRIAAVVYNGRYLSRGARERTLAELETRTRKNRGRDRVLKSCRLESVYDD